MMTDLLILLIIALTTIAGAESAYFEADTCCAIQTSCSNCNNVYHVNSITYCCPNCVGNLLVTGLVCNCKQSYTDPNQAPNCTNSNKIVGDYPYYKPSYYYAASDHLTVSLLLVISTSLIALLRSLTDNLL